VSSAAYGPGETAYVTLGYVAQMQTGFKCHSLDPATLLAIHRRALSRIGISEL